LLIGKQRPGTAKTALDLVANKRDFTLGGERANLIGHDTAWMQAADESFVAPPPRVAGLTLGAAPARRPSLRI